MADNEQASKDTTWYSDVDVYSADEQAKFVVQGEVNGTLNTASTQNETSTENSGKIEANNAENDGIIVKSDVDGVRSKGSHLFKPGNKLQTPRPKEKAWQALRKNLSDVTMAGYFLRGLELAIEYKSPKLILAYAKEYYDRSDGAPIPMLPDKANGFTAVIMALRGADMPDDDTE